MATGGGAGGGGGGGGGGGHDADYNAMADRFAAMRASDARDRLDRLRGMKPGAAPTTDSLEARMRQVRDAVYPSSNARFLTPVVVVATLSLYPSLCTLPEPCEVAVVAWWMASQHLQQSR